VALAPVRTVGSLLELGTGSNKEPRDS